MPDRPTREPQTPAIHSARQHRQPMLWFAVGLIAYLAAAALLAPFISPYDPNAVDLAARLQPASATHLLGTDHLGRDILSRLIWGSRVSLGLVVVICLLILAIGFTLGSISGWLGGWPDAILMRVCDVFMTFPTFILAMFLVGILGRGITNVVIAIVLTHWAWYARITRGMVVQLRRRDYIAAARLAGGSPAGIFLRHVSRPVLAQILILASLDLGHMMLHISGLSFLGLGIQAPTAEWGVMINDARALVGTNPGLVVMPGLMILLTVLAFNIPGERLRDWLDPALVGESEAS